MRDWRRFQFSSQDSRSPLRPPRSSIYPRSLLARESVSTDGTARTRLCKTEVSSYVHVALWLAGMDDHHERSVQKSIIRCTAGALQLRYWRWSGPVLNELPRGPIELWHAMAWSTWRREPLEEERNLEKSSICPLVQTKQQLHNKARRAAKWTIDRRSSEMGPISSSPGVRNDVREKASQPDSKWARPSR